MGVARIVLGNGRIAKLPVGCESGVDSLERGCDPASLLLPREDHASRIRPQVQALTRNKGCSRPRLKGTGRVHSDLRSVKYLSKYFVSPANRLAVSFGR